MGHRSSATQKALTPSGATLALSFLWWPTANQPRLPQTQSGCCLDSGLAAGLWNVPLVGSKPAGL